MEWKYSNEMSSFFLFEASGDSEGEFNHLVSTAHDDDDDAESCSCDSSELLGFRGGVYDLIEVDRVCGDHIHDGGDVDIGGHDDHRTAEISPREEGEEESKSGGADGIGGVVDEVERNRLFWETCLEVGLPVNYSTWF
ncbi:hypothetical protein RHGRI_003316 [Rhododendron griersonianum]|uniref:Uncharacterized protein n=2 Tax=Rhododendron griersonianum TaxID=479676 RepID=A0AAV6L4J6_9ERIC|nr:hypothetical protein RHGRI_003316 [Rhododendron griersonianum]